MESAILSSLGVDVEEASSSSNRVINAALVKSAPSIIQSIDGQNRLVSFFPQPARTQSSSASSSASNNGPHFLRSLLPYPNPNQHYLNLPLLRTLLSKTRSALRQSQILHSDSLRLKEQVSPQNPPIPHVLVSNVPSVNLSLTRSQMLLSLILLCNGTYENDIDLQNEEGEEKVRSAALLLLH